MAPETPDSGKYDPVGPGEALAALGESVGDLADASSLADVARVVLPAARRLTVADGATLALREDRACMYEDAIAPLWKGRRFALGDCLSGWSMLNGQAAVIDDIAADPRTSADVYGPTFVKSLVTLPIGVSEPIGAIGMYWARPHRPSEHVVVAARALAAGIAVVLARLQTAEELARSTKENVRLSRAVERHRLTAEDLRELSERDPLTGLLNRRAWDRAVAGALRKRAEPVYVALIDLDRFKAYNDRFGHPAGDALLRRAAVAWRGALRTNDILARYGGEEFAVVLTGCSASHALEIVERLRQATVDKQTVSIGLARWDGVETVDQLVCRADRGLYDAKRGGRNRVVIA